MVTEDDQEPEVTVKLIDFGFGSRILEGVKLRAKVGTFVCLGASVMLKWGLGRMNENE